MSQRSRFRAFATIAILAFTMVGAPAASAAPPTAAICEARNNDNFDKLLECVTLEGVREHQAAFQAIADANGGTRASGTPGYEESVDYVVEDDRGRLRRDAQRVPVRVRAAADAAAADAGRAIYPTGAFTGTRFGDVPPPSPPSTSTSCRRAPTPAAATARSPRPRSARRSFPTRPAPDDFAGFLAGQIALIQRGGCSFALKAHNAQAAGAARVIIFNQGNTPDRGGPDRRHAAHRRSASTDDDSGGRRLVRRRRGARAAGLDRARSSSRRRRTSRSTT